MTDGTDGKTNGRIPPYQSRVRDMAHGNPSDWATMRFLRKPHVWFVPMLGWYACRMFGSAWGFGPTIGAAFRDWKKRNDLVDE